MIRGVTDQFCGSATFPLMTKGGWPERGGKRRALTRKVHWRYLKEIRWGWYLVRQKAESLRHLYIVSQGGGNWLGNSMNWIQTSGG